MSTVVNTRLCSVLICHQLPFLLLQVKDYLYRAQEFRAKNELLATPHIVCGDMNGDRDEPFYQVFTRTHALHDAYLPFVASMAPAWTTWKWRTRTGEAPLEVKKNIDYIFVPHGVEVRSVAAPPTTSPQGLPSADFSSDHVPVAADLVIS